MKDLVTKFLSDPDRAKIKESVKKVERTTAGEIVPMVVSTSGSYPLSGVIGGLALSVPLALLGDFFIGPMVADFVRDIWVFLGLETVLFMLSYLLVNNVDRLKRLFIPDGEMLEQVRTAAIASFYREGLYRTKQETGVLIYVSIFEHMVWVLGDRGIHEKVGQGAWNGIVAMIIEGIKKGRQGEAICAAVDRAGEIMTEHFPVTPGDTDELPNLITGK